MRFNSTHAVVLVLAGLLSPPAGADWSAYLNGHQRQGFTSSQLDPNLRLAWEYKSPAKPQKAWEGPRSAPIEGHEMRHRVDFDDAMQVVMAGGRAYFGSTVDHRLHCVDAKTGEPTLGLLHRWTDSAGGNTRARQCVLWIR